jgi:hypothetical protein
VISGALIDKFDNWELPFAVSIALMGLGVGMASRMRPERRFQTANDRVA